MPKYLHRTKYPRHKKVYNVKFRLVVIILSKFQNKWENFYLILLPSYNILTLQLKKSAFAMVEQKSVLSRILIFIIGQFQWNEIIKYLQQGRRKV